MSGGVLILVGSFTMSCRRTIAGISITMLDDRQTLGSSGIAMGSARPANIKTTARRSETSCNGSKVAFNSSTRPTFNYLSFRWRSDHVAASTTSRALSVADEDPDAVIMRKRQYDAPGRGKKGGRRHHRRARSRHPARITTGTVDGWRQR